LLSVSDIFSESFTLFLRFGLKSMTFSWTWCSIYAYKYGICKHNWWTSGNTVLKLPLATIKRLSLVKGSVSVFIFSWELHSLNDTLTAKLLTSQDISVTTWHLSSSCFRLSIFYGYRQVLVKRGNSCSNCFFLYCCLG
jgi:hypothetical protein